MNIAKGRLTKLVGLWVAALAPACSADAAANKEIEVEELGAKRSVSLDEFKATSYFDSPGSANLYLYQGDFVISEADIEALYWHTYGGDTTKSAVWTRADGTDDVWSAADKVNITYCVANGFGNDKVRALEDMREATSQWMSAANVVFQYVPSQDAGCAETNTGVKLNVIPQTSGGGLGCGPYACSYLKMNYNASFGKYTWLGAWTHEVGHTVGLAHEHDRVECGAGGGLRTLTSYDNLSAMHYDTVCGSLSIGQMTALDKQGVDLPPIWWTG